jgi:diacylglycerol kinase (ATP)
MAKPGETGLRRIRSAAGYSMKGLAAVWQREAAFRQEASAAVVLLPAACWLGNSGVEIALMVIVTLLVLIVEILNSSIEAVVDRIGHEHHDLSGLAKDLGSAAVFMSLVLWALVWGIILLPIFRL